MSRQQRFGNLPLDGNEGSMEAQPLHAQQFSEAEEIIFDQEDLLRPEQLKGQDDGDKKIEMALPIKFVYIVIGVGIGDSDGSGNVKEIG